jgi:hypoxanthine phosphoribosyltransferase
LVSPLVPIEDGITSVLTGSYDYAHRTGVIGLTWDEIATLTRQLAEAINRAQVDMIVRIARAGLFPATAVSCALRQDLYPIRLSRRENDRVRHESPVWRVPVPSAVAGKRVALVDEIADSGETLRLAAAEISRKGARKVITATLFAHSWADPLPDCVAMISDALIVFPWDRDVLIDGRWTPHPELDEARFAQNRGSADESAREWVPLDDIT